MADGISRRGFLRRAAEERLPTRRRPPGAIPEAEFLKRCTACGDCVVACPKNAIHTLAPQVQPGPNTPVMVPDQRPCHMCDGFPCATACPEGALVPPREPAWPLGLFEVDATRCLPFRGPECGACADRCPPGAERALTFSRNRPQIDPTTCVGCGLCSEACPIRPSALVLVSLA